MRKVKVWVAAAVLAIPVSGIAAAPAQACMGEVCDAINFVCAKTITKGQACVK